jgi:hypothetical protein
LYSDVIFSGLLRRIQELYPLLCEKLVAKKVAVEMFQRDVLTFRELESIQMQKNPYKASEELLQVLLRLPEDASSALDCFFESLKTTNQQHIFLWIMYPGKIYEISSIFLSIVVKFDLSRKRICNCKYY